MTIFIEWVEEDKIIIFIERVNEDNIVQWVSIEPIKEEQISFSEWVEKEVKWFGFGFIVLGLIVPQGLLPYVFVMLLSCRRRCWLHQVHCACECVCL